MIDISIEIHVSIRNIKISLFLSDIVYSKNINTIHPPLDKWYATLCTLFFCTDTNIFNFYIRSELISFQLFRLFHSSKLLWTAGPIICCKNNRLITSTVTQSWWSVQDQCGNTFPFANVNFVDRNANWLQIVGILVWRKFYRSKLNFLKMKVRLTTVPFRFFSG